MFEINKEIKINFKCEIKTTSWWQQVTINKWVIAVEPQSMGWTESFNGWFNQDEMPSCWSKTQNSAVAVFGIILLAKLSKTSLAKT